MIPTRWYAWYFHERKKKFPAFGFLCTKLTGNVCCFTAFRRMTGVYYNLFSGKFDMHGFASRICLWGGRWERGIGGCLLTYLMDELMWYRGFDTLCNDNGMSWLWPLEAKKYGYKALHDVCGEKRWNLGGSFQILCLHTYKQLQDILPAIFRFIADNAAKMPNAHCCI